MRRLTLEAQRTIDQARRSGDLLRNEWARRRLIEFWAAMWSILEPKREFVRNWSIGAMCEFMEAVHMGHILDGIMNVPPGTGKSFLFALFTCWEWGPRGEPWKRYVTASYSHDLTRRDNKRVRTIVNSDVFQEAWGTGAVRDGVRCDPDDWTEESELPPACLPIPGQQSVDLIGTASTGFRIATSIGGQVMGQRGDRILLDDPNRTDQVDSLAGLHRALQFVTEVLPTRKNDDKCAEVLVQQRTHVLDVTGHKLRHGLYDAHLCLPMRFERDRRCSIILPGYKFEDPRVEEGELLFEERFPRHEVDRLEKKMKSWGGIFAVSGQMQQSPVPRGGGMFKRDWFKVVKPWDVPEGGRRVRGWDLAASESENDAATAAVLMRRTPGGFIVIETAVQRHLSPGPREAWMKGIVTHDGPSVQQDFPQDPGQAGKTQRAALVAGPFNGADVRSSVESGSKERRAFPLAVAAENGLVLLVEGAWNEDFLSQAEDFLRGARSDLMDAASRAYANIVRNTPPPPPTGPQLCKV